ncbi:MAG: helix-turn-helix transcriptional regulator [Verrucomicrobia bacterium]|nr:helix-turn-helix transcriptional regulator [Verrucomicrobiota bacterium]
MKTEHLRPLHGHTVIHTKNLAEGQAMASHIWAKHTSHVIGGGGYESTISRLPLGRCWLSYVDCRSPMRVAAGGNKTKATIYLPLEGSMKISVAKKILSALPAGPVLIPAGTPVDFRATPIRCVVVEIPSAKLRCELAAMGCSGSGIVPVSWKPGSSDATHIAGTVRYVLDYLSRDKDGGESPVFLRHLEALLVGCLAEALAASLRFPRHAGQHIGRVSQDEMEQKIRSSLHASCHPAELAAYAGLTMRALQQLFLKHFNTTPTAYIHDQRLAAARNELLDPKNKKSVTRVASDLEFHHLGRFSTAYRRKFGESPSATLAGSGKRDIAR